MKSVLVGNGINIEFGGHAYHNSEIISRLLNNTGTKDYSEMFGNVLEKDKIKTIIPTLYEEKNNIIRCMYDKYCVTSDEVQTLLRFKNEYCLKTSLNDIGLEDYFFIFRLLHKRLNDSEEEIQNTFNGLSWLILDAIYNDGKIQSIYENINPSKKIKLKDLFNNYDNIFTVNYDNNISKLTDREVFYLHGDFTKLHDQYNKETLLGRVYFDQKEPNPVKKENKHIYCNAVLGFKGSLKNDVIDTFNNAKYGIDSMMQLIKNGISSEDEKKLEKLRNSTKKDEKLSYEIIQVKRRFPHLDFHQYPSNLLKDIEGEINIIGLSPNNDEHIFDSILNNPKLSKIIYYYKSKRDKKSIRKLYPNTNIKILPVDDLWSKAFESK